VDSTTLIIIGIALLVLAGAALLMLRSSWGNFPSSSRLPPAALPPSVSAAGALDTDMQRELSALVAQGRKIEAIKRVREATGLGLKEAKDYVEALAAGAPVAVPAAPPVHTSTADVEDELRALLARGQKIEAIKRVREATGLGLKEAKDYVEALAAGAPVALPTARLAEVSAGDIEGEVYALLARGQKIEAIKRVREATGLGLKEAKDYVDRLESGYH
jgi:ribosomal protein L7/L12